MGKKKIKLHSSLKKRKEKNQ